MSSPLSYTTTLLIHGSCASSEVSQSSGSSYRATNSTWSRCFDESATGGVLTAAGESWQESPAV